MDQPDRAPERGGHSLTTTLVVLGTLGVTGAAAWLYFRAREPATDEQTWERLQPRGGRR